jgi:hypothetical protein
MKLALEKQYHLQNLEVLLRDFERKQMPHPPSHMEKESGAKV